MAVVPAFHTNTDADGYGDEATEVYHDRDECGYGNRVKRDRNDVLGKAGRTRCKKCSEYPSI